MLVDLGELERADGALAPKQTRLGKRFGVDDWLRWIKERPVSGGPISRAEWDEALEQLNALISEPPSGRLLDRDAAALAARSDPPGARRRGRRTGGCRTGARARRAAKDPPGPVALRSRSAPAPSPATDRVARDRLASELLSGWEAHDLAWAATRVAERPRRGARRARVGAPNFPALVDGSGVKTPWRRAAPRTYVSGDFQAAAAGIRIGALPGRGRCATAGGRDPRRGRPSRRGRRGAGALPRLLALRECHRLRA